MWVMLDLGDWSPASRLCCNQAYGDYLGLYFNCYGLLHTLGISWSWGSILHSSYHHLPLDWISRELWLKCNSILRLVRSRARISRWGWFFNLPLFFYRETFSSAYLPVINMHLSGPNKLDRIQTICSLLVGEHFPLKLWTMSPIRINLSLFFWLKGI